MLAESNSDDIEFLKDNLENSTTANSNNKHDFKRNNYYSLHTLRFSKFKKI